MAGNLESYLKGEPQSERIAQLMREGVVDSLSAEEPEPAPVIEKIDDAERDHLRHLLTHPGWQVLLQLLDSEIQGLEDAAKQRSLANPFATDNAEHWAHASCMRRARNRMLMLAQGEAEKLTEKAIKKNGSSLGH